MRIQLSVVIACYNCGAFVDRAIASALASEDVRLEVLLVDDQSTDNTLAVLNAWQRKDSRVRVFQTDRNGGPGVARNVGIAEARGAWIAVLDADDAVKPDRFARLLASSSHADIVADNVQYYDPSSNIVGGTLLHLDGPSVVDLTEYAAARYDKDYGLLKPIFRRRYLQDTEIRYPVIRHGEDWELVALLLLAGARFHLQRSYTGYLYTTRSSGLSQTEIDDAGLIKNTKTWLMKHEVKNDVRLRSALKERLQFQIWLRLDRLSGSRDLRTQLKVLRIALQSPEGCRWLKRWARNKAEPAMTGLRKVVTANSFSSLSIAPPIRGN